jgi:hypothetical protein
MIVTIMVSFDLSQCIFFSSFSAKMAEVSANFLHLFLKIMGNHDKHYHDRLKISPKQGLFIMVSLDQKDAGEHDKGYHVTYKASFAVSLCITCVSVVVQLSEAALRFLVYLHKEQHN